MRLLLWTFLLIAVIAACDAWILSTELELPDRVITKWTNGTPTNHMTRDEWVTAALSMTTLIGLLLGGVGALVVGRFPRFLHASIPELQEPIRSRLIHKVQAATLVLGAWGAVWMTWFHCLVLDANRTRPPQLESAPVAWWVGGQMVFVAVFTLSLFFMIREARKEARAARAGAGIR